LSGGTNAAYDCHMHRRPGDSRPAVSYRLVRSVSNRPSVYSLGALSLTKR